MFGVAEASKAGNRPRPRGRVKFLPANLAGRALIAIGGTATSVGKRFAVIGAELEEVEEIDVSIVVAVKIGIEA